MYKNAKANATVEIVDKTRVAKIVGNENIVAFYLETAKYTVCVVDGDGKAIGGVSVKFTITGKTYYGNTDANGYAYVTAKFAPGTYKVTAEYGGVKVTNDMVFKHIIKAKKTTKVKKSRKITKIKIVLKGKKVLKKKKLTIKLKGKKYKVKTNKKGVAYFKVTKKIIKKLKKGKKYKYDIIFKKDKLIRYIKVK